MSGRPPNLKETNLVRICQSIRDLFAGRSNAVGEVTLAAGVTSTVVEAVNCGLESKIFLFPQTSNAAAALGTTYIAPANVVLGQFTITHANNAQVDRTFNYLAIG